MPKFTNPDGTTSYVPHEPDNDPHTDPAWAGLRDLLNVADDLARDPSGRMFVSTVAPDADAPRWSEVGTVGADFAGAHLDPGDAIKSFTSEPATFTLDADVNLDTLRALYGSGHIGHAAPTHSLLIDSTDTVPGNPVAPIFPPFPGTFWAWVWWIVSGARRRAFKAYDAAMESYREALEVWEDAGRPDKTVGLRHYFPHARIVPGSASINGVRFALGLPPVDDTSDWFRPHANLAPEPQP